jgi:hypothetical protein
MESKLKYKIINHITDVNKELEEIAIEHEKTELEIHIRKLIRTGNEIKKELSN